MDSTPVRWLIPEVLRRYADAEVEVAPPTPATIADALEALFEVAPDLRPRVLDPRGEFFSYLMISRGGAALPRRDLLSVPVSAGDVLDLIGMAEGG